jgi:hypothetical protein
LPPLRDGYRAQRTDKAAALPLSQTRRGQFRAFLNGFFSGVGGHGIAALELLDRYVVCQQCGLERLENHGEEFK